MSKLPQEHPPVESIRLREYLSRTVTLINGAFSTVFNLESLGALPNKAISGMMRYFEKDIGLMPNNEGPWIYIDDKWHFMATPVAKEIFSSNILITQEPVGLDTPVQISFGSATSNEFIDLTAAGTVTILEDGTYDLIGTFNIGRQGSSGGTAFFFIAAFLNGNQARTPIYAEVNNPNIVFTLQYRLVGEFVVGDEIELFMNRDSLGVDAGGLFSALSSVGWGIVPSAGIRILKLS